MNKTEILEFLELPFNASDIEISTQLADKKVYYTRLRTGAASDTLRKIHSQNLDKIRLIEEFLNKNSSSIKSAEKEKNPFKVFQENNSDQRSGKSFFKTYQSEEEEAPEYSPKLNPVKVKKENTEVLPPVQVKPNAEILGWLISHTEHHLEQNFPLYFGENYIGRNELSGKRVLIIEDDRYISRVHARITAEESDQGIVFYIEDSAESNSGKPSKNGTYINGHPQRINRRIELRPQDTLQVGITKLVLKTNSQPLEKLLNEVRNTPFIKTILVD